MGLTMKERIEIQVVGLPHVQERHRDVQRGRYRARIDPSAESKRDFLLKVQQHAPEHPWDGPVRLEAIFAFPYVRKHYFTGKKSGLLRPDAPLWYCLKKQHDADNLLKFVMDAIGGVFFIDDGQVAEVCLRKLYAPRPFTRVVLERL